MRTAVCLGGDADTLACITGAVAGALHGLPNHVAEQARAHLTDDLRRVVARFEQSLAQLRYAERHRRGPPKDV
ncbi:MULTISPECIES: ADP-ribosylglycohydrolase family protein [Bradyrhizobium]|uniref:ADP-ribosylglycohydrolase family protein n=1 Tax=Bradyrhizobium TaxID=374 RepID=UPI0035C6F8F0|nr:ADP-ribosylglycohydrolase family protein [Bradyrhizobium brasilense]